MKNQYLRVLSIEIFLVIFSFFHFIFLKQFSIYLYLFELAAIYIVLKMMFKVDNRESHLNKYFILLIFIIVLSYYAITYISGFFIGFVKTNYSTSISGILRNVISSSILVILLENIREIIIQQGRYYKSLVYISLIPMVMVELLFFISLISFTDRIVFLQIILVLVIPCIFRNIFLTYSTYFFGKYGSLVYHFLIVVIPYVLPVFPNFSDYINTLINVVTPLLVLFISLNYVFVKNDKIVDAPNYYKHIMIERVVFVCIALILVVLIYLISNVGRYTIMAIGSESMKGSIDKGDVVLLDKNSDRVKVGDVIAFYYNGQTIIHRVVEVNKGERETYKTKGDANNNVDSWLVNKKDIIAKTDFKIKYIGWPTVLLSEFLTGRSISDEELAN